MNLQNYLRENWISIAALSISLWLLYRDYLQPFKLTARAVGRITLSKNPWSVGLRENCIHLDLVFSNQGAKRGVVEDVAIELRSGKDQIFLRSYAVIRDRSLNLGKEIQPPDMESFIGFELGKLESVVKRILFVPHNQSPISDFQAKEYDGVVWVKHSKGKKWKKMSDFTFVVEQDDLVELAKSSITPQPDGRFYIYWPIRDKVLKQTDNMLVTLLEKLSAKRK